MRRIATPPRPARWLLERALPEDAREEIAGDLEEVFVRRVVNDGAGRARLWYWRETVLFSLRFMGERVRGLAGGMRPYRGAGSGLPDRGRRTSGFSLLDFRLGVRMLFRYPGLTVVGVLAMAFAIWVGAGSFEFIRQVVHPQLPLEEGHRVVGIQLWDAVRGGVERRALHDLETWREELSSIEDVGGFRAVHRNLAIEGSGAEPIEAAEISASAFRVARARPLLGRTLVDGDEQAAAPPVVVIGYDVWQRRFGGDPDVIGRSVRLGSESRTVVGVMPEGFLFPVAHSLWVPLRISAMEHARREGPAIRVFGRLAPGVSMDEARVELATLGARAAADHPATHEHLRPQVMPYARSIINMSGLQSLALLSGNVLLIMLLVLICSNVALLMFARAASRESELMVRSALGASRGRIVVQLFTEALVLGGIAAVIGLGAAGYGLRWALSLVEGEVVREGARFPFWFNDSLSAATIVYAILLTLLGAAIAGVLPALKVTRGIQARLREAAAGGNLKFGGVWIAVIIAQVAVTVAFPAAAYFVRQSAMMLRTADVGIEEQRYLTARFELDRTDRPAPDGPVHHVPVSQAAPFAGRVRATYRELERRLMAEPAVTGVTFADRLPRMYHPARTIEVDAGGAAPVDPRWPDGYRVSSASVDPRYFDVLEAPILAGRGFTAADVTSDAHAIIVNESFVRSVLGGRNPVGRRVRPLHYEEWDEPRPADEEVAPWYEIVGVVEDLGMSFGRDPKSAGFYHAVDADAAYPIHIAMHVNGDAKSFVPRLRQIANAVDPGLRLYDPMPLNEVSDAELQFLRFWFQLILMVSAVALVLSLAGIYSITAFTVARRTREIGIRIALGSSRRGVIHAILARSLTHIGIGTAIGIAMVASCLLVASAGDMSAGGAARLIGYAALMMAVCMLACIVPTRRALRIQPTEAMRQE
jgi:putative ABC transport system permease protein